MGTAKTVDAEAEQAIRRLLARYAHLVDDTDLDAAVELFDADGQMVMPDGTREGREAIHGWLSEVTARGTTLHQVSNVVISAASHERGYHAVSDLVVLARDGEQWRVGTCGRYHDTIVEREGQLRFAKRIFTFR